jgi:aspartate carbamoyltransferase catalytic subunit
MRILSKASEMEGLDPREKSDILRGKTIALLFFEPSTRTRLSFESAVQNLGGKLIGFSNSGGTSITKGESLIDTIKTIERYADIIIIRHPLMGSARLAAQVSKKPVINAGDGANQHPTQTLLDLYTIQKSFNRLERLKVGFIGDLKYSRTVHSLSTALSHFDVEQVFISPPELRLPEYIVKRISPEKVFESDSIFQWLGKLDVLYATRIQRERFVDPLEYEKVKNAYRITKGMLSDVKPTFRLMHPLPRVDELSYELDSTPYALYFDQLANGIPVREAILTILRDVKDEG